jgi:membrane fusion protein (multidrug efflux system)
MSPPRSSTAKRLDEPEESGPVAEKATKTPPVTAAPPTEPKKRSPKKPLIVLGAVLALGLGSLATYSFVTRNEEFTDDAQVEADIVPIGARVGGQVRKVADGDNRPVKKGEVLVELDDETAKAHLDQAKAELETAEASEKAAEAAVTVAEAAAKGGLTSAKAQVSGSSEAVTTAGAQVKAAEAAKKRAEAEARRTGLSRSRAEELFARSAIPKQELDNAVAADDTAKAGVDLADAQLEAARQSQRVARSHVAEARGRLDQSTPIDSQIAVARAQAALASARVKSAKAAVSLAELNLSYTRIVAPADGIVSKSSVHEGQLVQAGQAVAEFVPAETYVVANFKETQIARIHPGDRAVIELDAYPGRKIEGTVESLSAATGARFSLLPPDNASGNFVKVVQRVPVLLHWKTPPSETLPAGLSAEVTVYVHGG